MSKPNLPKNGKCRCNSCYDGLGDWKPASEFYLLHKDNPELGYQKKCKACARDYQRDYTQRIRDCAKQTTKRALQYRQEREDELLRTIDELLQDVQDCGATPVEAQSMSAKLRSLIALYWEIV